MHHRNPCFVMTLATVLTVMVGAARVALCQGDGETLTIMLPGDVPLEIVHIPAGSFQMGSPDTEGSRDADEAPVHGVTIDYDFYMGRTEVTQAQWLALMGIWPGKAPESGRGLGDDYPAYFVSWNDARDFISALNTRIFGDGQGPGVYRLPSEAEWEYACRAGTTTRFSFGDSLDCAATCLDCVVETGGLRSDFMWYCGNNDPHGAKAAGTKHPNAWGLHDMHGNLWEWCQDWYHDSYMGAPLDGGAWESPAGTHRVVRGGHWGNSAKWCRSANRAGLAPDDPRHLVGFRLARMQAPIPTPAPHVAPVLADLPNLVVSDDMLDDEFVIQDALDTTGLAGDPDDGPGPLVWSYAGGGKYAINGVAPLDLETEDPLSPPAGKIINQNDLDTGNPGQDTLPATLTIRNVELSPIGGPFNDPGPNNADGIVPSQTEVEMMFVSDGADTAMTELVIYTENDGRDQLSSGTPPRTTVSTFVPGSGPADWRFNQQFVGSGTVTSAGTSEQLCMEVTADGVNAGEWFSPWGATSNPSASGVDLTDNAVYDFRFYTNTNQSTVGKVPLISFILDISDPDDPTFGAANAYNQETFFLDNLGGTNSPLSPGGFGRTFHSIWFAPSAVSTPQWCNGTFTTGNDSINDFRIRFRVFDIDGAGYNAEADQGQVCLLGYDWTRWDLGDMLVVSTEYDVDNISMATSPTEGTHTVAGFDSNIIFSGGNVMVTPATGGGYTNEFVGFTPGDTNNPVQTGGQDVLDNYPVQQQQDVIILTTVWVSQTAGTPLDLLRHGTDNPTQENISLTVQTAGMGAVGMPTTGASQEYLAFTASNSVTASTLVGHNGFRPRFDIICNKALSFNAETSNTAGIILERMKVDIVNFGR